MYSLAFSTFFQILEQCKNSCNQEELFKSIIAPLACSSSCSDDKSAIGKYKKGEPLVKRITNEIRKTPIEKFVDSYKDNLNHLILADRHKHIICALRDIIKNDSSLDNETTIGSNSEYTKEKIITSTHFDFFEFVSNISYFCLSQPNKPQESNLPKSFCDNFNNDKNKISLTDTRTKLNTPLELSVDGKLFQSTFTEINTTCNLETSNKSDVRLFVLNLHDKKFSLRDIKELIKSNIHNYVFSRTKIKDMHDEGKAIYIVHEAVNELRKTSDNKNFGDHFGDIMLYIFLENYLKAPKVFSKLELDSLPNQSYKSESAGVHFFESPNLQELNNQLIFGVSKTLNDIEQTIDDAISKVAKIEQRLDNELTFLNKNILDLHFSDATTNYLKKTILPNKEVDKINNPDSAFGIFIAYSIDTEELKKLDNVTFKEELHKKLSEKISSLDSKIYKKIDELNLSGYSFYFYFLPLINVESDKDEIMNGAIGFN